jgi:putative metallopeptidase
MPRVKKQKAEKEKIEWRRMPEVEALIEGIVKKHHKHLDRARIVVLGKPKAARHLGKRVEVVVRKPTSATQALLAGEDAPEVAYLIEVGLDLWGELDPKGKRRLLDYALCHFTGRNDKDTWEVVGPDVEFFTEHYKRWGAHTASEEMFVEAARQLDLPFQE